jgi:hypothetical protein
MTIGTILATPARLTLAPSVLGTTQITWSNSDSENTQIWVSTDGEQPETLFAEGQGGTQAAGWIEPGHYYLFKLYEGTAHTDLLAWTSVTTQPPPASQLGFDYWPANNGWPDGKAGSAALDDANWSVLRATVAADLDHMVSLGAGVLRLMFWPEQNGFVMPGKFPPELAQQARNLVDLLSLCAARNLQVIIAFGNNYFDSGPDPQTRWWMQSYGNTTQGFTNFLNDCKTWINAYVEPVESSPNRATVIYYDYQNEYHAGLPYMGWYVTFLHDWSAIPRGKHGISVLGVPADVDDLQYQLANGGGPELGRRRLDYIDFHVYPDQGVNANVEDCFDHIVQKLPGCTPLVGEFGYLSAVEDHQWAGVDELTSRCKTKGIAYYLNWLLWDDHSIGGFANTPWGYDMHTPKRVLGGMAAKVGLLANSNFDIIDAEGRPVGWEVGGSTSAETLTLIGPDVTGDTGAAATHRFASISTGQPGSVWLSSAEAAAVPGQRIFVNAYLRSNMQNVRINIIEYDSNRAHLADNNGSAFTPTDFRFGSYLHRVGSWSVLLGPKTSYVIVNVSADCPGPGPSYLDVAAVSAAQR